MSSPEFICPKTGTSCEYADYCSVQREFFIESDEAMSRAIETETRPEAVIGSPFPFCAEMKLDALTKIREADEMNWLTRNMAQTAIDSLLVRLKHHKNE
jgi:hypothetical protein